MCASKKYRPLRSWGKVIRFCHNVENFVLRILRQVRKGSVKSYARLVIVELTAKAANL